MTKRWLIVGLVLGLGAGAVRAQFLPGETVPAGAASSQPVDVEDETELGQLLDSHRVVYRPQRHPVSLQLQCAVVARTPALA